MWRHAREGDSRCAQIGLDAIIPVIFILAAAATPSTIAAPPTDACPLLTSAEVGAIVGATVGAGAHITPTYLKSCTWTPPGGATKDFATLILALETANSFETAKSMMQAATQSHNNNPKTPLTVTQVNGVGTTPIT